MSISFNESKSIAENNNIILNEIRELDLSALNEQELVSLANILFKLFKANFENNNYSEMAEISNYCNDIITNCIERKFHAESYCAETIIDIACFVYEQMYLYEEKVNILKSIVESESTNKELKIRALEELLSPEPEVQQLVGKDIDRFSAILKQFSS